MVEQAVDEDEVIQRLPGDRVLANVDHREPVAIPPAGVVDVLGAEIDAQIVDVEELLGVRPRAAADIEDTANIRKVVVPSEWRKLCVDERPLPQAVDRRMLQDFGD